MDASIYDKYITSLYYYIFTVATIGYGDISPTTSLEKLFACVNMLFACGVSAYIIGSMGNIISSRYDAETNFKRKMDNLIQFLVYKKISPSLKLRIKKYLEHALEKKKEHKIDESEVLLLLNKNLREEISLHINGQILKSFVVLCKYDELCILLTYVMKEETMNPNETIFHKDDVSNRVYFLTKGNVFICEQDTKIIFKELDRGRTFGELGFFSRRPRICAAETKNFINLSYLNIDDFKHYAYQLKLSAPNKFKGLRDEIEDVLIEIRKSNFLVIHSTCFLCASSDHMAPDCDKLNKVDEYYKFKFTDKSHKTEYELEHIFQRIKIIKLQSKTTLENQMDFSISEDEDKFFEDSRFEDEEEDNIEIERKGSDEESQVFDESGALQTNSNLLDKGMPNTNIRYSTNLENIIEISGSHVDSDESRFKDSYTSTSKKNLKMLKTKSLVKNSSHNEEITTNENKDDEFN